MGVANRLHTEGQVTPVFTDRNFISSPFGPFSSDCLVLELGILLESGKSCWIFTAWFVNWFICFFGC